MRKIGLGMRKRGVRYAKRAFFAIWVVKKFEVNGQNERFLSNSIEVRYTRPSAVRGGGEAAKRSSFFTHTKQGAGSGESCNRMTLGF